MRLAGLALSSLLITAPARAQDAPDAPAPEATAPDEPVPTPAPEESAATPAETPAEKVGLDAHGTNPDSYDAFDDNTATSLSRRLPRRGFDQRTMRDHMFQDPQLFDDALVTSHVGLTGGVGGTHAGTRTNSSGEEYTRVMGGFGVGIDLAARFGNSFGIFTELDGNVLVGVNHDSAMEDGANANSTLVAGVAVRLLRIADAGTQLALKPKYRGSFSVGIRPNDAVTAAAEDPPATALRLFVAHQFGASLDHAQALGGHWASLQVSVEYLGGRAKISLEDSNVEGPGVDGALHGFSVGAAPTLDLWPFVPLGFQVEYRFDYSDFRPESAALDNLDWTGHAAGGSLFYTGHPDFQLGVSMTGQFAGQVDNRRYGAQIALNFRGYL